MRKMVDQIVFKLGKIVARRRNATGTKQTIGDRRSASLRLLTPEEWNVYRNAIEKSVSSVGAKCASDLETGFVGSQSAHFATTELRNFKLALPINISSLRDFWHLSPLCPALASTRSNAVRFFVISHQGDVR